MVNVRLLANLTEAVSVVTVRLSVRRAREVPVALLAQI
jgi:hypothetical protein